MNPAHNGVTAEWQKALAWLGLSIGWVIFWYWQTLSAMVYIWYRSETFAHCFIVIPISLWLIWRKRHELGQITPQASPAFGVLLLGASGLWLLGDLAAVNAAAQLALVATLILIVPAVLGVAVARAITFPLLYMLFAVPIGEFAMPIMMQWTAHFTVIALRLTGIPVYQEGLQFVIPSGNWSVVEACSGIRYLIASTVLGTLFAYLNYSSPRRRALFIAASILVPILANWLRAYLIVSLGHYSSNALAVGADHLIYGWAFFGLVMFVMFMIGARWTESTQSTQSPAAQTVHVLPAAPSQVGQTARHKALWQGALLAMVIVVLPHGANLLIDRANAATEPKIKIPGANAFLPWAPTPAFADWQPAYENPSDVYHQSFQQGDQKVGVVVAYYRNQNYGRKLVSSNNVLVKNDDSTWATARTGQQEITLDGQPITVKNTEIRRLASASGAGSGTEQRLKIMSFYWINGQITTSDSAAKISTALSRLRAQGDDSALVVVYASKPEGKVVDQAEAANETFIRSHGKALLAMLKATREQR